VEVDHDRERHDEGDRVQPVVRDAEGVEAGLEQVGHGRLADRSETQ